MTTHLQERIHTIFERALELNGDERSAYILDACGDNAELREEVESLLTHDAQAPEDFMPAPEPTEGPESTAASDQADKLLGRRVAKYTIKSVIGSGGMGTVYEAQQQNPKRIVALKVLHAGVASRSVLRRFEHESQILARLLHPNIAQIYEAGTFRDERTGSHLQPFFAMERVPDARTITRFAEEQGLSTRERLDLFRQVCDAVQHGHQKGVIHRDLKPGNILVDSSGQVKIIDFGVARSTDSDVAATTLRTDVGQLIGTLQYMSPEQCEADPLGLDVRSDVYTLGVVLFELLTGRLPYDVSNRTLHSAARMICEQTADQPSKFDRKLRGDIEVILLKALEKEREIRYQSAAELLRDIRRFLNREPIDARPPSFSTRVFRWCIQRPVAATTSICLFIAIAVLFFTVLAVWLHSFRPHRIEVVPSGHEARLIAFGGVTIHSWQTNRRGKVMMAKLGEQPASLARIFH